MHKKATIISGYMNDDFLFAIKPLMEKAAIENIGELMLNAVNAELTAENVSQIQQGDFQATQENCVTLFRDQKIFFTRVTFIFIDKAVDLLAEGGLCNHHNAAEWFDACLLNYTRALAEPLRPSIESPVLKKFFG